MKKFIMAMVMVPTLAFASEAKLRPQIIPVTTQYGLECRVLLLVDAKGKPQIYKNVVCDFARFVPKKDKK